MSNDSHQSLATEHEIRDSVADLRDALSGDNVLPNIWGFYSPKNQRLLTLLGDVAFIQAVILEGDSAVISYSVEGDMTAPEDQAYGRILAAQKYDGEIEWLLCCRYESTTKSKATQFRKNVERERERAAGAGWRFFIRTEKDLMPRMTEFWNWLALCSAMTRARDFNKQKEIYALKSHLADHKSSTFEDAMRIEGVDPALIVAVVANQLATGLLKCDLVNQSLNGRTRFWEDESTKCVPQTTRKQDTDSSTSPIKNILMRNRRTSRIPEMWLDIASWPAPNIDHLVDSDEYRRKREAVEMYFGNHDFTRIKAQTGLSEDWLRVLVKKCLHPHVDGRIHGFRALVRYSRTAGYRRQAPLPSSNLHEGRKGGYAGAMTALFQKYPDLLNLIEAQVLKKRREVCDNQLIGNVRWIDLKAAVHTFLRGRGVKDSEYPFNTRDQGYATLSQIGRSLLFKHPTKFIKSRFGSDAARFSGKRSGELSLIHPTAPFQVLEADFHKHDSATTVEIDTPIGGVVDALVPRFWIGCAVDVFDRAIIATSDSFEPQTTDSCVLDLIDACIAPPKPIAELTEFKACVDGYWQPNQILPQFAWHGWDIIKLDRAWAHKSSNAISRLIATSGSAVCYGRPGEWWARPIVERTFGELTQRGSQRLSTSYGTGPADPHRQMPEEKAKATKLRRWEICVFAKSIVREINSTVKEGNYWETPLSILRRCDSDSRYFPRPLPLQRKTDRPTRWVSLSVRVDAYPQKGIAPSVRVNGCRYYGDELHDAWHLMGQFIIIEIARDDIRIARAIDPKNGDIIGKLAPEKKWRIFSMTWQNFILLQKFGRLKRNHSRPESVTNDFIKNRQEKLFGGGTKSPAEAKKAASDLDRIKKETSLDDDTASMSMDSANQGTVELKENDVASKEESPSSSNLVSLLNPAPEIRSFSRK